MAKHKLHASSSALRWMLYIGVICLIAEGTFWTLRDSWQSPPPLPNPVVGNVSPSVSVMTDSPGQASSTETSQASADNKPFIPTSLLIQGVGKRSVQALGRIKVGDNGFSLPDPEGLDPQVFAWDADGAKPGSKKGAVNFTAHTYPPGQEALGNFLYEKLQGGDVFTVIGRTGKLQYQVVERVEVRVADYPADRVLDASGSSMLTITVCSGERRGPGDWTMRTIWFAVPVS
ncbi:MAG TPA: class F sortase [Candidatus Saccharimonadales bacterium]